jgi:two-component system, NarL family, sensor kinase
MSRVLARVLILRYYQGYFRSLHQSHLKGTSLGLYISKSIIEAHGGEINAENNKEWIGATFGFNLSIKDLQIY